MYLSFYGLLVFPPSNDSYLLSILLKGIQITIHLKKNINFEEEEKEEENHHQRQRTLGTHYFSFPNQLSALCAFQAISLNIYNCKLFWNQKLSLSTDQKKWQTIIDLDKISFLFDSHSLFSHQFVSSDIYQIPLYLSLKKTEQQKTSVFSSIELFDINKQELFLPLSEDFLKSPSQVRYSEVFGTKLFFCSPPFDFSNWTFELRDLKTFQPTGKLVRSNASSFSYPLAFDNKSKIPKIAYFDRDCYKINILIPTPDQNSLQFQVSDQVMCEKYCLFSIAFNNKSSYLACGLDDGRILMYNTLTWKVEKTLQCISTSTGQKLSTTVYSIVFSQSDKYVFLGTSNGTLYVFSFAEEKQIFSIKLFNDPLWQLCVSGQLVYCLGPHSVKIFDITLEKVTMEFREKDIEFKRICITSNLLVVGCCYGKVLIFNSFTGKLLSSIALPSLQDDISDLTIVNNGLFVSNFAQSGYYYYCKDVLA